MLDTAGNENGNWYRRLSVERVSLGVFGLFGFAVATVMTFLAIAESRSVPPTTWLAVVLLETFGVLGLWLASVALTRIPVTSAIWREDGIEMTIGRRLLRVPREQLTAVYRVVPYWRAYVRRDSIFDRGIVRAVGKVNPFLLLAARVLTTRRRCFVAVSYVVSGPDAYALLLKAGEPGYPPQREE